MADGIGAAVAPGRKVAAHQLGIRALAIDAGDVVVALAANLVELGDRRADSLGQRLERHQRLGADARDPH